MFARLIETATTVEVRKNSSVDSSSESARKQLQPLCSERRRYKRVLLSRDDTYAAINEQGIDLSALGGLVILKL